MNHLQIQDFGPTVVAALPMASLTAKAARELRSTLRERITPSGHLILDLARLTNLDSASLILIMDLQRKAKTERATIWVTGLQPAPQTIAELVRLAELVEIRPSVEDALRAIQAIASDAVVAWAPKEDKRDHRRAMAAGA